MIGQMLDAGLVDCELMYAGLLDRDAGRLDGEMIFFDCHVVKY